MRGWTFLALAGALGLANPAQALCRWIPICLKPYDPPIDSLGVYINGVEVNEYAHWYYPNGNVRTSLFVCYSGDESGALTVRVSRGGVESPDSPVLNQASYTAQGCTDGALISQPFNSYPGPTAWRDHFVDNCLHNSRCADVVISQCLADPQCLAAITDNLGQDIDQSGGVNDQDAKLMRDIFTLGWR